MTHLKKNKLLQVMKLADLMVSKGRLQEALDTLEREGCKYEYLEREESAKGDVLEREAHRLLQVQFRVFISFL